MEYVALHWNGLCLQTVQSSFSDQALMDMQLLATQDESDDDAKAILDAHFQFAWATVRRFGEFGLMFRHFPWRFQLLLHKDAEIVNKVLEEMQTVWKLVLRLETTLGVTAFPLKDVPYTRWYAFREVMTLAEESAFKMTEALQDLVQAWTCEPAASLACEASFRQLRLSEKDHASTVSPSQLQAVIIKAINDRYKAFSTISPAPSDVANVPANVLKKAVFCADKCTASDSGLANFNNIAKTEATSAHYLTKKSMNLLDALLHSDGSTKSFWVAELARPFQATRIVNRCPRSV